MLRRSKYLFEKPLKYKNWIKTFWEKRVNKTFKKNFFLPHKARLSFSLQKQYKNLDYQYYKSQNKLQCMYSANFSVPSKRILVSRFFFNKNVETLTYGGSQKKN